MALAALREQPDIDYALVLDADDQLVFDQDFDPIAFKESLEADMYDVEVEHGSMRHWRPHLLSNHKEFCYRGVIHEFVEGPPIHTRATARGFRLRAGTEGVRSRNPSKYLDDANLLTRTLGKETNQMMRQRYMFYLAQSLKDGGMPRRALSCYLERAAMGGWEGEVYISLWRAAQLMESLEGWDKDVTGTYMRAFEADPTRAEALNSFVNWCHRTGRHHQGYMVGKHGITLTEPTTAKLFAEPDVYKWSMLDNFAVAAYWSEHYRESLEAAERALLPAPKEHRQRIADNVRFAKDRLDDDNISGIVSSLVSNSTDGHDIANTLGEDDVAVNDSDGVDILREVDFTVVAIEIPGYVHSGAYAELAETVLYGLRALNYTVELRHDQDWSTMGGQLILLGAHLTTKWPPNAIIYNTEHASYSDEEYFELLKSFDGKIWDYSESNARQLSVQVGRHVHYVPVGYVPELTRIEPSDEEDIDVLFYGALNERRQKILDKLRGEGLNVQHLFGVYGAERDAFIARAKVVLCMHYYLPGAFESARVSYLLANKKVVVCEVNPDEAIDFSSVRLWRTNYDFIVNRCRILVKNHNLRESIKSDTFTDFKTYYDEPTILQTALRRKVWDCFLYNGEEEVLAIRLNELKDEVDHFVIIEADTTFSGLKKSDKPLTITGDSVGLDRIIYIQVTDMPHQGDPWARERHQRNAIMQGLTDAAPDDLVMISDVDEIPRASVVREMAEDLRHEEFGLRLKFYYFMLNYRATKGSEADRVWNCAVTKRQFKYSTSDRLRYHLQNLGRLSAENLDKKTRIMENAGWHFSNLTDDEGVRRKIQSFSHQEYNTPDVLASVDVEGMIQRGEDLFGRGGYGWQLELPDDLPAWVSSQKEFMMRWTR
jgi:hypothetical protein